MIGEELGSIEPSLEQVRLYNLRSRCANCRARQWVEKLPDRHKVRRYRYERRNGKLVAVRTEFKPAEACEVAQLNGWCRLHQSDGPADFQRLDELELSDPEPVDDPFETELVAITVNTNNIILLSNNFIYNYLISSNWGHSASFYSLMLAAGFSSAWRGYTCSLNAVAGTRAASKSLTPSTPNTQPTSS